MTRTDHQVLDSAMTALTPVCTALLIGSAAMGVLTQNPGLRWLTIALLCAALLSALVTYNYWFGRIARTPRISQEAVAAWRNLLLFTGGAGMAAFMAAEKAGTVNDVSGMTTAMGGGEELEDDTPYGN